MGRRKVKRETPSRGRLAPMIVVRAETMGLCPGVRRALALAESALRDGGGAPVVSLGPLVHNGRLVEDLRRRGLLPVEGPAAADGGTVVIRSHGVGPSERRALDRPGLRVVDATCPTVRRIHGRVADHAARGFFVVVAGEAGHEEARGIAAHAGRAAIVATPWEAEALALEEPLLLVAQTTFDRGAWEGIRAVLARRSPGLTVVETLCGEVADRETAVRRLAPLVEAIVVVGSRSSANTRRLLAAAVATGRPAWQVEGADGLPAELGAYARVGITAGASTPESVIGEVEAALPALGPA
jgi:4-hydroxy-3-methylbut-2-en-1-yl diphosphate reductase